MNFPNKKSKYNNNMCNNIMYSNNMYNINCCCCTTTIIICGYITYECKSKIKGRQYYTGTILPPAAMYRYNIASRQYCSGGSNVPLHRDILKSPRPSDCLSVTFSFRKVTQQNIAVFYRNLAGTSNVGTNVSFYCR